MKNLLLAALIVFVTAGPANAQRRNNMSGGPKVGAKAPDFKARSLGPAIKKGTVIQLSKIIKKYKKPVVLIFGSYT